ncbi:hypothetical protein Tco_0304506 [Tanacetum coccineum]
MISILLTPRVSALTGCDSLHVISSVRIQKYAVRGCPIFLIQMTDKKEAEKKLIEVVHVLRDFVDVFPEDLPGLMSTRQFEFHIELMLGAAPIARAPYHLALPEIKELSE